MKNKSEHAGFTLIELLVVMGILMFLFGLGIAILPAVYQKWTTTKGAEMVQGALARARQEARRSGHSTGIRLSGGPTVTNLTFVQQPIDLTGGTLTVAQPNTTTVQIAGADLSSVQTGDYLEICGSGLPHQITGPGMAALTVASPLQFAIPNGTSQYRIMRQAQLMKGERPIMLPNTIAVDMSQCSTDGKTPTGLNPPTGTDPNTGPYYDILFSPGGGLTGRWLGSDKIILYVRDTNYSNVTQGKPTLIVIYVRTGLIAAHPVDNSGVPDPNNGGQANVYFFCNNGQSSGL